MKEYVYGEANGKSKSLQLQFFTFLFYHQSSRRSKKTTKRVTGGITSKKFNLKKK